jgi:hypothetical protein
LGGLTSLNENQYCLPLTINFETFDAFAGIRSPFLLPGQLRALPGGVPDDRGQGRARAQERRRPTRQVKLEKLFAGELGGSKIDLGNMSVVFVTTADVAAKPAWRHKRGRKVTRRLE